MKLENWKEEFDKEFPNSRGIFENGDPYDLRRTAIKNFISSQIQQAQEDILEEVIKEINNVKNTSAGEQQWFDGLRVCRSIAEKLKSKIKENK